jgi:hypothetical protein
MMKELMTNEKSAVEDRVAEAVGVGLYVVLVLVVVEDVAEEAETEKEAEEAETEKEAEEAEMANEGVVEGLVVGEEGVAAAGEAEMANLANPCPARYRRICSPSCDRRALSI